MTLHLGIQLGFELFELLVLILISFELMKDIVFNFISKLILTSRLIAAISIL